MTYQPNFTDPRVISRIKQAIGFACGVMSETKPHEWSTRYIDKYFGSQRNDLSKYLRKTLLICTDHYVRFNIPGERGICKKYILNKEGVRFLNEALKNNNIQLYPIVVEVAKQDHTLELDNGNFEYNDQSNRLWHPLQRYRKQYRTQILSDHGYIHDYDIECCAPTLLYQYAQHLGMDEYLFALNEYLRDRTRIRQDLAQGLELEIGAAKEIITALFAGARIANHKDSDIYNILNGDRARIEYLKQHEFLTQLRKDIAVCWEYITPHMSRRRKSDTNRLIPITSKQKWNVYFELERLVINSVRTYLDERSVRYFLMHDGWACDREIDQIELKNYVRNHTGYEIKFEYTKNNNIQLYPIVVDLNKIKSKNNNIQLYPSVLHLKNKFEYTKSNNIQLYPIVYDLKN